LRKLGSQLILRRREAFGCHVFASCSCGAVLCAATLTSSGPVRAEDSNPIFIIQGAWSDQGSRIMQHSWLEALKQSDGSPFLGDSLGRAAPVSWIFRVFYSGWTLRGRDRLFSCVEPAACPFIDLTAIFLVSLQGLTPNIS
jgi:hypothetical protein